MFIINKIKIISAVILALTTAATVFSACQKNETPVIPDETFTGTHGEMLGVSYYTVENESETQTFLFEITTKKQKKTKPDKNQQSNVKDSENRTEEIIDKQNNTKASVSENDKTNSIASEQENKKEEKSTEKKTDSKTQPKHVPIPYVKPTKKVTEKPKPTTVKQTQPKTVAHKNNSSDETIPEESEGINVVFKTNSVEKGNTASIMIQGTPGKKYTIEFYINQTTSANYSDFGEQTADENGFVTWTFNVPMNCESGNRKIIIKEKGSSNFVQTSIDVK